MGTNVSLSEEEAEESWESILHVGNKVAESGEKPEAKDPRKDETSEEEELVVLTSIPGPGVWVISESRDSKCLHITGQYHRKPGIHYYKWTETKPGVKQECFKKACKVCFRLGYPLYSAEEPELVEENLAEGMPHEVALEDGDSSMSE